MSNAQQRRMRLSQQRASRTQGPQTAMPFYDLTAPSPSVYEDDAVPPLFARAMSADAVAGKR